MRINKNFRDDLPASIVVFLVAMPLCLGIAMASGVSLYSGIIGGVIGGIVVGLLSGSALGVSGPAAGLVVIVLNAVTDLGFEVFLVSLVLAGILQVIMGYIKAGIIAYYFPSSVIDGMLAGIGILIFLKQIPHAFGYDKNPEGNVKFLQSDGQNTFSELVHIFDDVSGALVIAIISLTILVLWETKLFKTFKFTKLIQGPLVVVILGILLNKFFMSIPLLALSSDQVVNIPVAKDIDSFLSNFVFPNFITGLSNPQMYITAIAIAVVASLETLLSVEAVDKQDSLKRITPTNRELKAQGIGNILSGMIGGMPITQVIIRSSVNQQSGGRTKASTIIHGILLLVSIIVIPKVLNLIPLSTLASILLVVGFKLAKPSLFKKMYNQGKSQFIPFLVTIIGIILTDLLVGIALGMVIAIFIILRNNYKIPYTMKRENLEGKGKIKIVLSEDVTFLNKATIQKSLEQIPKYSTVEINAANTHFIHHDIIEIIENFEVNAKARNINVSIIDLYKGKQHKPLQHFEVKIIKTQTKEIQENLTPKDAHRILVEGNQRFIQNINAERNLKTQVIETSRGQYPFAVILSCIDSRVPAELVFDQGIGDIFSVRVAGNVINKDVLGSMEYACKVAGSKIVVVMGHTKCGAVTAAYENIAIGNITGLLLKIKPAVDAIKTEKEELNGNTIEKIIIKNIQLSIERIRKESVILSEMEKNNEIEIVGALYSVSTGKVEFYES